MNDIKLTKLMNFALKKAFYGDLKIENQGNQVPMVLFYILYDPRCWTISKTFSVICGHFQRQFLETITSFPSPTTSLFFSTHFTNMDMKRQINTCIFYVHDSYID